MIDNFTQAMDLIREMEAQLPIPVYPSEGLAKMMRGRGVTLHPNQPLSIKKVLYSGDEGGILCDITPPGQSNVILCSLTHVRVPNDQPLAEGIQNYQLRRTKRLTQTGALGKPVSFTIKPHKKRKR